CWFEGILKCSECQYKKSFHSQFRMNALQFRLQAIMVLVTMVLFVAMLALNEWLWTPLEFVRGINWIYLPAGVRLLSTLLFAEAGALGLLLVSWLVSYFYFFPEDLSRSTAGAILATLAPYSVYRAAQSAYGLNT